MSFHIGLPRSMPCSHNLRTFHIPWDVESRACIHLGVHDHPVFSLHVVNLWISLISALLKLHENTSDLKNKYKNSAIVTAASTQNAVEDSSFQFGFRSG